jgi:4-amino-4-deoxy-L-arabinose transferase-like glycosyltransferase
MILLALNPAFSNADVHAGMSDPESERSALDSKRTAIFPRAWRFFVARWAECVLGVIVVSATLLSLYWVFTVPLLQNPDETSHLDYAFSIYSAGRLLNVRRPPSEWNVHSVFEGRLGLEGAPYERISHQYTLYLIDAVEFQRLRFHFEEKVPPNYGTASYYRSIDLNAPTTPANVADLTPEDNPWLVTGYPFGYYALVAIWLKVLSLFSGGPATLLLGARILSVILLAGSLILTYTLLRELHLRKARALVLTFIVGFFPLTTFMSSSVQPDNLTLFLMLLCFYCALLLQPRGWDDRRLLLLTGLMLGGLVVTKYHIFLFAVLPILGMTISDHIFQRKSAATLLRKLAILLVPSALFFAVQLWVIWGAGRITGGNLHRARASGLVGGVKKAVLDFYRGGPALVSWWGQFGWMDAPLIIRSPAVESHVLVLLSALTLLVLLLLFFRLEQVLTRLIVLAAHGRWRMALRIAFSNPLVNSHSTFTVFMIFLYAFTDNSFYAQGRHWFPYIVSGFLITTQYVPRALTHRKTQATLSALLLLGLLVYCLIGSYYSIETIKQRYYAPHTNARVRGGHSIPSPHLLAWRVAVKVPTVERNL